MSSQSTDKSEVGFVSSAHSYNVTHAGKLHPDLVARLSALKFKTIDNNNLLMKYPDKNVAILVRNIF